MVTRTGSGECGGCVTRGGDDQRWLRPRQAAQDRHGLKIPLIYVEGTIVILSAEQRRIVRLAAAANDSVIRPPFSASRGRQPVTTITCYRFGLDLSLRRLLAVPGE
jgi:hypothetical protein